MTVEKIVNYDTTSPYYDTGVYKLGLDVMTNRSIPKYASDQRYQIDPQYHLRPDLLAFDLYGTPKLWWVFANRNPSVLKDPMFDFKQGVIIYIPSKTTLQTALGI